MTAPLCPANVFGLYPSRGSRVNNRAVISREVVMKHLFTTHFGEKSVRGSERMTPSTYFELGDHCMLSTSS